MHPLMLTQQVDRQGWVTGFTHQWITELARHEKVDRLTVIALEVGEYDLPDQVKVYSMGKEHGYSRPQILRTYWQLLYDHISSVDVIFGHMIPRYTWIAAPLAKMHRIPMVQWYTHKNVTLELRLVHALINRIVTASLESYDIPGDKVTVLGHGIDTTLFAPGSGSSNRLIVAVGRLSPIKHYDALIQALAVLITRPNYNDVRLAIAGGTTPQHHDYQTYLETVADQMGVRSRIDFLGPVPHAEIPGLYDQAAVTVNLCPTGGADKAVLESMASGVPVVVRNQTFLPLLADDVDLLWSEGLEAEIVADKLAAVLDLSPDAYGDLGQRLRTRMMADYSLTGFIDRLVTTFEEVIG